MRISAPNILFFLFFSLASWLPNLYAQTYINGGPVSGTWTPLNNPYIIQGDNSMLSFFVGSGDEYFLRFYNDHNIELKDMHLSGGFAKNGGAIQIENGDTILFDNLKFENNAAIEGGGAVYCKGNHGLQINNCEFSFNT